MKITRKQLKELVAEAIRKDRGILLETEPLSAGDAHPGDRGRDLYAYNQDEGGVRDQADMAARNEVEDVIKTLQDLYHLGQKASQLHDILQNEDRLEPEAIKSITIAATAIGDLFDSVLYEKTKGNVQ